MPRCNNCRGQLGDDRDQMGARCPHCRCPLFERSRDPHQVEAGMSASCPCTLHASNPAIGTCHRCGNFICTVCRTRWRNQVLCIACAERVLGSKETDTPDAQAHRRQAVLGLVFSGIAWAVAIFGFFLIGVGLSQGSAESVVFAGFGMLILLVCPLPAILGLGQAAAAIRARGDHMILATVGLFLSGLNVGVMLGFLTSLVIWQSRS